VNLQQLREIHQSRPFRPFTLHVADGKEYAVGHPEFLAISQSGRTIIVATPADTFDFIDVRHVTSIQLGGNGNQPHPQSRES
jgi:hypothetical protein